IPFLFLFSALSSQKVVLLTFTLSAAALSVFGIIESVAPQYLLSDFQSGRRSGYLNPIHYGNFAMLLFAGISTFYIFGGSQRKRHIVLWTLAVTTLAGAIGSGSRGALLSL
ncbi:MAG: hypothetical protein ACPHER_07445, partial [Nevskiales bacterium]